MTPWLALVVMAAGLVAPWAAAKPKAGKKTATSASASASAPAGPKPLAETLTGQAKQDYESARLLYGDGDHAGALLKFKAAYEQSHDARLLWNMGACEKNLRHYAKVLVLVRRYLEEGGALLTDQDRTESRELLNTVEAFTAALKLTVNEAGAEVFVDDESVGATPLPSPVVVDIGVRRIRVKKEGFVEHLASLPVGGSKEVAITVDLVKEVHEGKLTVKTSADASIWLDGKLVGKGTWTGSVPSGGHTLRVTAEGMVPYQSEVLVQDKENRAVEVPLARVVQPIVMAKPEEETGALHGFELGLRTGYGFTKPTGTEQPMSAVGFVPIGLDIGYRLGRPTYLGLSLEYAAWDTSNTCGVDRHGAAPLSPADLQARYGYDQCVHMRAAVTLLFHMLPRTIVDPWFGFDVGPQLSYLHYKTFDPLNPQAGTTQGDDGDIALNTGAQIGIDVRIWRGLAFGPFARAAMLLGDTFRQHEEENTGPTDPGQQSLICRTNNGCNTSPSSDGKGGPNPQAIFGLRVAYTF
ncbi:MAG: PEGA domain-containing protein [Deltaproteobacteria bacterium]|nr:PEGA domain-containing protein [Deltaproteobacteria bacterium]